MSDLPETRSPKRRVPNPRPAALAVALVGASVFLALILIAAWSSASSGFSPGEEIYAPGVEDVAAGAGGNSSGTDAQRFGGGVKEVFVYLRVEDVPGPVGFAATVEHSGRSSLWSRFFGPENLVASAGGDRRLSASGSGVSGVIEFSVRARDGEPLPAGEYTVSVRFDGDKDGGPGAVVARKYFVVGDPQA